MNGPTLSPPPPIWRVGYRSLATLAAALVITATATLSSAQTIGFKERTSNDFPRSTVRCNTRCG